MVSGGGKKKYGYGDLIWGSSSGIDRTATGEVVSNGGRGSFRGGGSETGRLLFHDGSAFANRDDVAIQCGISEGSTGMGTSLSGSFWRPLFARSKFSMLSPMKLKAPVDREEGRKALWPALAGDGNRVIVAFLATVRTSLGPSPADGGESPTSALRSDRTMLDPIARIPPLPLFELSLEASASGREDEAELSVDNNPWQENPCQRHAHSFHHGPIGPWPWRSGSTTGAL